MCLHARCGKHASFSRGLFSLCLSLSSIMENESRLVDTLHAVPAVGEDYIDSGSLI